MAQNNAYTQEWCPARPQASYPNYYYIIEIEVKEQSWDISTNKSTLFLESAITGHEVGFDGSDDQYLEAYWWDARGGERLVATTTLKKVERNHAPYTVSGTIQVEHNDDGTLSGYAYTIWGKNGSNSFVPPESGDTVRIDAGLTLTTIPRKSIPSVSGTTNIGSQITINTNRKANTFTHTLTYSFGSLTNRQIATNVTDSIPWTIPNDFYAQIPNDRQGTMTLSCTTYSGSNTVGTETINVPIYVDTNQAKTTLGSLSWTIDETTRNKTGATNKYINNFSTLQSLSITAANSYSSPIKTITLYGVKSGNATPIETKSYTGSATSQTATFTNKTGLNYDSFKIVATDKREIPSNDENVGITTIAYVPITTDNSPTIGRTSQTGSQAKITKFKGNFWNDNFGNQQNELTIQWRYKESGGSYSEYYTIPSASISLNNNTYTISNYTFTNGTTSDLFTYTKLYDIEFKVTDSLKEATPPTTYRLSMGVPNFVIFQNVSQKNGRNILTKNDDIVASSIRTKNIFSNYAIICGWLDNGTILVNSLSKERLAFVPCKANTTYTISRETITSRFRVGDYTTIPIMTTSDENYTPGGWVKNESASSITYRTSANAKYLIINYANGNYDTETDIKNVLNSLQVEEGSSVTTYTPSQAFGSTKWIFIAEVSGETAIQLPNTWNEIMIVSWRNNNIWNGMTMVIPYGAPNGINYRLSYYGGTTDNINVGYYYSTSNTIKLGFYNINGTGYNSEAKTQVYYR